MMTNFKINIHVTRSSLITSIKKAISIVLVTMLTAVLSGCGGKTDTAQRDEKYTAEQQSTEEPVDVDVSEPNQDIEDIVHTNDGKTTEEPTEATTEVTTEATTEAPSLSGQYTYTAYGVEISMDINVDDYVSTADDGTPFFRLYDLAADCGWKCIDDNDFGYMNYIYSYNDMEIYLSLGDGDKIEGTNTFTDGQYPLNLIDYKFINPQDYSSFYYEDTEENVLHKSILIYSLSDTDYQYIIPGRDVITRDNAIILAYLISFVNVHPGENPFCYVDYEKYSDGTPHAYNIVYTF